MANMVDPESVVRQVLQQWLKAARRLCRELGRAEPDEERVAALLEERRRLQQQLSELVEGGPDRQRTVQPSLTELLRSILEVDRIAMGRATAIRAKVLDQLAAIRRRQETAAGYRRTLTGLAGGGASVCDRLV